MEKAVLISIRPEWCEKIASGEKTIEVRKSRPKLDTPFKCYIYCTFGEQRWRSSSRKLELFFGNGRELSNGKVIGEFVCDSIVELAPFNRALYDVETQACLTREEIVSYLKGKGYGWHISDLFIYDKPKALSDFRIPCKKYDMYTSKQLCCGTCEHARAYLCGESNEDAGELYDKCSCDGLKPIKRAPQSWCYVEPIT